MKQFNIGGSILPSSSPEILKPLPFNNTTLQVIPQIEEDTHALFLGQTIIAKHPNGFSCHSLAKRMIKGDPEQIRKQAEYIVSCGGWVDMQVVLKN